MTKFHRFARPRAADEPDLPVLDQLPAADKPSVVDVLMPGAKPKRRARVKRPPEPDLFRPR